MKIFLIISFVSALGLFGCSNSAGLQIFGEKKSPAEIGKLLLADFNSRQEFMMYNVAEFSSIHYAEACAAFGALKVAGKLGDSSSIKKIFKRYERVAENGPLNTKNHVDANVYGILPLELFMQTSDSAYFREGIELADIQWENPLPNGMTNQTRYWIDDIYMISSLQVQAYRATGRMIYLERAAFEIDSYIKKLQQPNGLFFHGNESKLFWGRGNGWVAAGLAELLSELPETNPYYTSIHGGYIKMMNSLKAFQCEDGMWRQLIDNSEAWKETSASAMFGFAVCVGVKKGLLDKNQFKPVYEKAWNSLCNYVNADGKIREVCVGTGQVNDVNYYLERPRVTGDFHGQAPMLWFAYSLLEK